MPEQLPDATTAAPKTIDQRFDEVEQAFLDQRDFTTFCFDKLSSEMRSEFVDVRVRFGGVEGRLGGVEGRLGEVEGRLGEVEGRLGKVEGGLGRVERRLDRHEDLLGEILAEVKSHRPR